jgi:hypothetical protein
MELKSERVQVADAFTAVELFFERRWTDGLAIVPPTVEKVTEMIDYVGRNPQEVLGEIPPYEGMATIEKLAINSVMAGCLPEYFPVVIAAVEAVLDPKHNLNGTQTTLDGGEPLIIVNGPMVKKLNINSGYAVFGRGYRANGTIGRALRLILWNLGRNFPGEPDKSTLSHPGAWSFCIAENEEASPWEPLHVERGLPPGSSGVTVFQCGAPHAVNASYGNAKLALDNICGAMRSPACGNRFFFYEGEILLVLNALQAEKFGKEGWSKRDVKTYIWEHTKIPYREVEGTGLLTPPFAAGTNLGDMYFPKWIARSDPDSPVPITPSTDDIHVVIAGHQGGWCAVCDGWGLGGRAVTREMKLPQ